MMDWTNESYVRLYVRDTGDMLAIGWQGRAVLSELLRKVDRAGVLDESDPAIVAELIRVPLDVVEVALDKLKARGVIVECDTGLVMPNFICAQECTSSDKQRKKESRARRRDQAMTVTNRDIESQIGTPGSQSETEPSQVVTGGHSESQVVTLRYATQRSATLRNATQRSADTLVAPTRSEVTRADIECVYKSYPKKTGKAKGMATMLKAIRTREELDALVAAVAAMANAWAGHDTHYCPGWAPFAAGRRWLDDELPLPQRQGGVDAQGEGPLAAANRRCDEMLAEELAEEARIAALGGGDA